LTTQIFIKNGRIIDTSQNLDLIGDLLISNGLIEWIKNTQSKVSISKNCEVIDASNLIVCPGFIDLHSHLREPGYEDKETIATGTLAAARGGFTSICAMPNTNPVMDTMATIDYVKRKAQEIGHIKVFPIGCVTKGRLGKDMTNLFELADAGAIAFSDDGNPISDSNIMRQALTYLLDTNLPIIDHCEDYSLAQNGVMNEGWVSTLLGLKGVSAVGEENMVARNIRLAELTGGNLHIAHISTAGSLNLIKQAKENNIPITCEVTPHHLTLNEESVLGINGSNVLKIYTHKYDTRTKVNPPLRSRLDVEAMVNGLETGIIDIIATDHAPHTQVDKQCTYDQAAFGISNFETALGSVLALVENGQVNLSTIINSMTYAPAQILNSKLGTLSKGASADVTIFDPKAEWVVDSDNFTSKGKNTPLAGTTLKGKVLATLVNGTFAYRDKKKLPTIDAH